LTDGKVSKTVTAREAKNLRITTTDDEQTVDNCQRIRRVVSMIWQRTWRDKKTQNREERWGFFNCDSHACRGGDEMMHKRAEGRHSA
jgi:hypothetical protein